jgi:hypothetical protein
VQIPFKKRRYFDEIGQRLSYTAPHRMRRCAVLFTSCDPYGSFGVQLANTIFDYYDLIGKMDFKPIL